MTRTDDPGAAVRRRIEGRIRHSDSLLKAMGFTPEAFLRITLNALITTPKLQECDPDSVEAAVIKCLNAGLVPDGEEAVIIPRKGKAAFQYGYKGNMRLVRQATPGLVVYAKTVYQGDIFTHREGMHRVLEHEVERGGAA